ncbi:MAG: hypothetical protein AMJ90_05480 [candidate division Zixibacteria bacterium SM23_73_2]|nr:MAG: hypothetical protein AMJ90_05480 [candidate division Zixibacteria bacterium SM23_73_2]
MKDYRILVVDDEKVIREFLKDFLSDQGYGVDLASDGKEALDKVRRSEYDLIITDIKMPNANGIEVLKELKQKKSNTAVIMITGYPSVETETECRNLGASGYLVKPFSISQIQQLLESNLNDKQSI